METFSSCYFCGVAVDAAVEKYPLVRTEAFSDIDTDQRIFLCPSCRRKLTTVIERVLEAAFDGTEPAVDTLDPDQLRDLDADEEMTATSVSSLDDESAEETTAGIDTVAGPAVDTPQEESDTDTSEGGQTADDDTDAADTDTESVDDADGDPVADPSGAEQARDSSAEVENTVSSSEQSATAPTTTSEDAEANDASTASDESREYTKSEFNKIVRLLQNRDFPVEIDELVVVSKSAYQIDEGTCHAVIDALIDRGVVVDQGEELVRP